MKFSLPDREHGWRTDTPRVRLSKLLTKLHRGILAFRVIGLLVFVVNVLAFTGAHYREITQDPHPNGYEGLATMFSIIVIICIIIGMLVCLTEWVSKIEDIDRNVSLTVWRHWVVYGLVVTSSYIATGTLAGIALFAAFIIALVVLATLTSSGYYYLEHFHKANADSWQQIMERM